MNHNNPKRPVYYKYLLAALFTINYSLFTINCSFAQQNKYNEVVKIVADYTPTISDAFKINLNPKIEDTIVEAPKLNYSINSVKMKTSFDLEPIKPGRMLAEPLDKLYNSYLKAGFGNYVTPYAEYFFNSLRSKDYNTGFHIKHISSNASEGIDDYNNSNYSNTEVNVYGKYFLQNCTVFGDVNNNRDVVHYYGYEPGVSETTQKNEDKKQRFSLVEFNAAIMGNHHDASHLDDGLTLKVYNLSDLFRAKENYIALNGFVSKNVSFMSTAKDQKLMLTGDLKYYNDINDFTNTGTTNYKIIPQLLTDFDKIKVNLGLNINATSGQVSQLKIYPLIDVNLNLVNDMLYAYAGISGEMKKNNMREFSDDNPFISSFIPMDYTKDKFMFYGGLKGSLSKYISYDASVSTLNSSHMPFFVTDTASKAKNKFTAIYDDAQILNLKAEISYQHAEKIAVMLRGDYYNYSMTNELYAWEKPAYDLKLSANYHFSDQLILKAEFVSMYKIYARTYAKENNATVISAQKINDIFDINFGAEYRFTKQLSAFLNFNNIGNYRYYRWYNYPSQRFNFLGGVSYAF